MREKEQDKTTVHKNAFVKRLEEEGVAGEMFGRVFRLGGHAWTL